MMAQAIEVLARRGVSPRGWGWPRTSQLTGPESGRALARHDLGHDAAHGLVAGAGLASLHGPAADAAQRDLLVRLDHVEGLREHGGQAARKAAGAEADREAGLGPAQQDQQPRLQVLVADPVDGWERGQPCPTYRRRARP